MARFRYLGEPSKIKGLVSYSTHTIRVHCKDGTKFTLTPVPPKEEFVIGEDIGHDITDPWQLVRMRNNSRFEEIG